MQINIYNQYLYKWAQMVITEKNGICRAEFSFLTSLFAFHFTLMPLGKVWICLLLLASLSSLAFVGQQGFYRQWGKPEFRKEEKNVWLDWLWYTYTQVCPYIHIYIHNPFLSLITILLYTVISLSISICACYQLKSVSIYIYIYEYCRHRVNYIWCLSVSYVYDHQTQRFSQSGYSFR